jgi:hypothetical protein
MENYHKLWKPARERVTIRIIQSKVLGNQLKMSKVQKIIDSMGDALPVLKISCLVHLFFDINAFLIEIFTIL